VSYDYSVAEEMAGDLMVVSQRLKVHGDGWSGKTAKDASAELLLLIAHVEELEEMLAEAGTIIVRRLLEQQRTGSGIDPSERQFLKLKLLPMVGAINCDPVVLRDAGEATP